MLPSLPVRLLRKSESSPLSTEEQCGVDLRELCANRVGVIDLWHTKCTRCPAAIEKLNGQAEQLGNVSNDVLWLTCALSQGEGNVDVVADLVTDDSWSSLDHIFVEEQDKDACKAAFGYSAVPFYVVFDHTGKINWSGEPKGIDLLAELKALLDKKNNDGPSVSVQNGLAFDDDF